MSLPNVWSRVLRRSASWRRRQQTLRKPARQGRSFVPRLELLEDRTVLSTLIVTNPADSGDGSLRAILALASSGDTITFDPSLAGQTITLTSGELVIDKSLDIEGLGADQLTVSGNDASRVFDIIRRGVTVTIAGLTITHGQAAQGGAIHNAGGNLLVSSCTLSKNLGVVDAEGSGKGGAIFSDSNSKLTVSHSTLVNNMALGGPGGGARALGGAIYNQGSGKVTQSTVSDNQAFAGADTGSGALGGAIFNGSISPSGGVRAKLTVTQSDVTGNQARGSTGSRDNGGFGAGGGIENSGGGTLIVTYSTLSGNQALGPATRRSAAMPAAAPQATAWAGPLKRIRALTSSSVTAC